MRRLAGEAAAQFWTDAEVNDAIHFGEQYVGQALLVPEKVSTFLTVNGTREYTTLPAGTVHVKSIDYDGFRLQTINYAQTRDTTAKSGRPTHYYLSQRGRQITVGLYPTPNAAKTVTALTVIEPTEMTADSTHSEVPDTWIWAVIMFGAMILKFKEKEFNEIRALAIDMMGKLIEFQQRVRTTAGTEANYVRDADDDVPDLAFGRLWVP